MVTKIKLTKLGKKARVTLNLIEIEAGSFKHATPTALRHSLRGRKDITAKELQDMILPALADANLINIED